MDKANKEKTDVEFIVLGTKLILEILAEECPNKDFKVDCNPIKSHNFYHFIVEDRIGDIAFKVVLTGEDFRDKSRNQLKEKAQGHISDYFGEPDYFGDSD